ncbi:4'-phosphopantetheinyl transferase superfamily protein [Bacillus cereus group sp. BfR-BA-01380]|uniref:4'-phosphopantetheinyl transferase family protein n=1 Tax=Bacillus cereus group sp. BfR-BA-01380 TaxID=2920324 RepID=UPI001F5613C4|nr:4'-phosphopantetheinyl transferase superfamily protein [Bacillus cereus group sp. BfR-BA-01380]
MNNYSLIEEKSQLKNTPQLFAIQRGECLSGKYMNKLPVKEQERIKRYQRWEDRQNTFLATKMVRRLLSEYLDKPIDSLQIFRDELGRPKLIGQNNWLGDFNVSHSGEWVICAMVGEGRVGIDIEKIRPIDFDVAKYCFTMEELDVLFNLNPEKQLSLFYELWTLKESFVKAIGQGLSYSLNSFGFDMESWKGGRILLKNAQGIPQYGWHFRFFHLDEKYRIALCSNQQLLTKSIKILSRNTILSD